MAGPLSILFTQDLPHSNDISAFERYTDMLARFEDALVNGDTSTREWQRIVQGLRYMPPTQQITQINEIMNKRPYFTEIRDYWMAPGEFLKYGGDCEDFCIAKYLALRDMGHAEEALRIVIVDDLNSAQKHAILAINTEESGALILDNQDKSVKRAIDVHRYMPIYSINRLGWWYHQA